MAHVSDPRFLVLHGLRLKGFALSPVVAELVGLDEGEVTAQLAKLESDGMAEHRDGVVSGWSLTPAGRAHHAAALAQEVDAAQCRDIVQDAYSRFLQRNQPFLSLCSEWQLRPSASAQTVNDHTDRAYDQAIIGRLRDIDQAIQPVCADLARALVRFRPYGPRLSGSLSRVEAGEHQWFTGALVESYHTVWFELHEDLLATLAIQRGKEPG